MQAEQVVHVIDDDDAARDSLAFLLRTAEYPVRAYGSAAAFLDDFKSTELGCIITDMRMPGIDGLELLRRLKDRQISTPVIVVTGHADVPLALEPIKAGAADFIEKPYDHETLLGAVNSALGGKSRAMERSEIQGRVATLSPSERQVLNGLVAGQSNKAIASRLQVNLHTIEVQRASIMEKMQATSLSRLVRMMFLIAS
ncbi:MAG TPA: response regulator FixJ [Xanthobacteraceae bacterium]